MNRKIYILLPPCDDLSFTEKKKPFAILPQAITIIEEFEVLKSNVSKKEIQNAGGTSNVTLSNLCGGRYIAGCLLNYMIAKV